MRSTRRALALAATLATCLALAACGSTSQDDGGGEGSSGARTLVYSTTFAYKTLDPARDSEPTGDMLIHNLYETLLTYEPGSEEPAPSLAESYSVSDDGRVFTFELDPDARFSDGTPVTAADVEFSLRRLANIKGPGSYYMTGLSVRATGERTVEISARTPALTVPAYVTLPYMAILNSRLVRANGGTDAPDAAETDRAQAYLDANSAGSAPYVLDGTQPRQQFTLAANARYWGGSAPAYDRVIVRNVTANTQELNVQRESGQIAADVGATQAAALDTGKVDVHTAPSQTLYYVAFNAGDELGGNADFRRAVQLGLDYAGLAEIAGEGARVASGYIPDGTPGGLPAGDVPERDAEGAQEALARAGVASPSIALSYPSDGIGDLAGVRAEALAQRIQADLEEVGIAVELDPAPETVFLDRYQQARLPFLISLNVQGFADASNALGFQPGGGFAPRVSWTAEDAPETARIAREAAQATSETARATATERLQRALLSDAVFVPLFWPAKVVVSSKDVGNVQLTSYGAELALLEPR